MAKEFKFPDVGEGIQEGEVVKWRVKEGDTVKEHQIIAEVETDKAIVEIPSPYAGKVLKIPFKEGDTVKVGETFIVVGEEGEKAEIKPKKDEKKYSPAGVVGYLEEAPEEEVKEVKGKPPSEEKGVLATPYVRRLAKQLNVDITKVKGTGPDGRVTENDVKQASGQKTEPVARQGIRGVRKYDMWGYIDRIPLKGIRKVIAEHMTKAAYTAPQVTHFDEADVMKLKEVRDKAKRDAEKKGIKLTYLPYVIKAVVAALKQFPKFNATLDEENQVIIVKKYFNIGIAVDTEDGLIVPVVKAADRKSLLDIAKEAEQLSENARTRKIDLMDLRGGSFTISNIGSIGGFYATPIINYPEVSLLMTGRMYDKIVMEGKKVSTRKALPLSLTFDHRVIDGADAARFVNVVKEHLKNPNLILKEK